MAQEECCSICAEPLKFCAFGPCNHNTVCDACVIRLRLLKKDLNCPICRNECPSVFVTRFMDDHTKRVPADRWEERVTIPATSRPSGPRSLWVLKSVKAVFDDEDEFQHMRNVSGLTHPALAEVTDVNNLTIRSLKELRQIVQLKLDKQFCDLCLKNRPVFTSEQVLYSKAGLLEHKEEGDSSGPLKESNFKGHPRCNWCKQHFYDSQEIYRHMEQHHYHCHLCRRENPDDYTYFKDYAQLERHFENKHHLCPFDECKALKFMVFREEAELKRHVAVEHGDQLKMSRQERRAALTLEAGFYTSGRTAGGRGSSRGGEEPHSQRVARPPIVINGGGAGAIDMRARANAEEAEAAADIMTAEEAAAQRTILGANVHAEEHFPGLAPSSSASNLRAGPLSAGWSAGARGGGRGMMGDTHAFPALGGPSAAARGDWGNGPGSASAAGPGTALLSKGQKKKLKKNKKREDDQIGFGDRSGLPPAHMMNVGLPPADAADTSPDPSVASGRPDEAAAAQEDWDALPAGAGVAGARGRRTERALPADPSAFSALQGVTDDFPPPPPPGMTPPSGVDFPRLEGAASTSASAPASRAAAQDMQSFRSVSGRAAPLASSKLASAAAPKPPAEADFPSLGPSAASAAPSTGWSAARNKPQVKPQKVSNAAPARPQLASAMDFPEFGGGSSRTAGAGTTTQQQAPSAPAATSGGISKHLRQANEALLARIRAKLSPGVFKEFRSKSDQFIQGDISAETFHKALLRFGLASEVSQFMALCPNEDRREEMLACHQEYLERDLAASSDASSQSWVPPEAVAAAAQAASAASWKCEFCTLVNAPDVDNCEACRTHRMVSEAHRAEARREAASDAQARSNVMSPGKKNKRKGGVKLSIQDMNAQSRPQYAWSRGKPGGA